MNLFEQNAHDIQYRKKERRSYPHEIETYTGNNKSKPNIFLTFAAGIATAIVVLALLGLLMAVFPD